MASDSNKNKSYPGHDEGTTPSPFDASQVKSPATHAPLQMEPSGVNVKTDLGKTGKA